MLVLTLTPQEQAAGDQPKSCRGSASTTLTAKAHHMMWFSVGYRALAVRNEPAATVGGLQKEQLQVLMEEPTTHAHGHISLTKASQFLRETVMTVDRKLGRSASQKTSA
ncbi:hypothetical protein [Rhizobium viscosum]|uniref:Uncharacterized protein n=1 Tax=Rhizobium viscosum TaxID=1673 RepID=A0ABR9IUM7_RHIVS|nr:hypothetical protein [Rhizobium viscosum]MBE1506512.1 hypothetical protein [Rhizobium viscosum]